MANAEHPASGHGWHFYARLVAIVLLLAVLAAFIAQNFNTVEVNLLTLDMEMELAWWLLLAAAIGLVCGVLVPRFRR